MKRSKVEQLHTALLSYIKRRNIADSEQTFKTQFKFEESVPDMVSRLIQMKGSSTENIVSLMPTNLDDYFTGFTGFNTFVKKCTESNPELDLKSLLFPVFVHLYLDLVVADRLSEANQFFQKFSYNEYFSSRKTPLLTLKGICEYDNLKRHLEIPKLRNEFSDISLNENEEILLVRFLQQQSNLVILKVLTTRLNVSNVLNSNLQSNNNNNKRASDALSTSENGCGTTAPATSSPAATPQTEFDSVDSPYNDKPMIISPPSLTNLPPAPITPVKVESNISKPEITMTALTQSVSKVRNSAPRNPDFCFLQLKECWENVTQCCVSNDRRWLCAGFESSVAKIWDISLNVPPHPTDHSKNNPSTSSSSGSNKKPVVDISKVHFCCSDESPLNGNETSNENTKPHLNSRPKPFVLRGHSGPVYSSCFTHDDKYILTCSEDTSVRLWSMEDRRNKVMYHGHNYPVNCIAMSNLSFYFATGSYDCTSRLWSLDRTFPLRVFAGHSHSINCVSFHNNSTYLATADSTVRLWDVNSGKTVRLMTGHKGEVLCLCFSSNGKWLASSGEDSKIRIWDIASGNVLKEFRGHTDTVTSLSFSPDDSLLVSSCANSYVRVWSTLWNDSSKHSSNANYLLSESDFKPHFSKILSGQFWANNVVSIFGVREFD